MTKNKNILIVILAVTATVLFSAEPQNDFSDKEYTDMTEHLDLAWKRMFDVYYSPETHLFYGTPLNKVSPARILTNGFLDPDKNKAGYGVGMEDCPIFGGVLLSMLADKLGKNIGTSFKRSQNGLLSN